MNKFPTKKKQSVPDKLILKPKKEHNLLNKAKSRKNSNYSGARKSINDSQLRPKSQKGIQKGGAKLIKLENCPKPKKSIGHISAKNSYSSSRKIKMAMKADLENIANHHKAFKPKVIKSKTPKEKKLIISFKKGTKKHTGRIITNENSIKIVEKANDQKKVLSVNSKGLKRNISVTPQRLPSTIKTSNFVPLLPLPPTTKTRKNCGSFIQPGSSNNPSWLQNSNSRKERAAIRDASTKKGRKILHRASKTETDLQEAVRKNKESFDQGEVLQVQNDPRKNKGKLAGGRVRRKKRKRSFDKLNKIASPGRLKTLFKSFNSSKNSVSKAKKLPDSAPQNQKGQNAQTAKTHQKGEEKAERAEKAEKQHEKQSQGQQQQPVRKFSTGKYKSKSLKRKNNLTILESFLSQKSIDKTDDFIGNACPSTTVNKASKKDNIFGVQILPLEAIPRMTNKPSLESEVEINVENIKNELELKKLNKKKKRLEMEEAERLREKEISLEIDKLKRRKRTNEGAPVLKRKEPKKISIDLTQNFTEYKHMRTRTTESQVTQERLEDDIIDKIFKVTNDKIMKKKKNKISKQEFGSGVLGGAGVNNYFSGPSEVSGGAGMVKKVPAKGEKNSWNLLKKFDAGSGVGGRRAGNTTPMHRETIKIALKPHLEISKTGRKTYNKERKTSHFDPNGSSEERDSVHRGSASKSINAKNSKSVGKRQSSPSRGNSKKSKKKHKRIIRETFNVDQSKEIEPKIEMSKNKSKSSLRIFSSPVHHKEDIFGSNHTSSLSSSQDPPSFTEGNSKEGFSTAKKKKKKKKGRRKSMFDKNFLQPKHSITYSKKRDTFSSHVQCQGSDRVIVRGSRAAEFGGGGDGIKESGNGKGDSNQVMEWNVQLIKTNTLLRKENNKLKIQLNNIKEAIEKHLNLPITASQIIQQQHQQEEASKKSTTIPKTHNYLHQQQQQTQHPHHNLNLNPNTLQPPTTNIHNSSETVKTLNQIPPEPCDTLKKLTNLLKDFSDLKIQNESQIAYTSKIEEELRRLKTLSHYYPTSSDHIIQEIGMSIEETERSISKGGGVSLHTSQNMTERLDSEFNKINTGNNSHSNCVRNHVHGSSSEDLIETPDLILHTFMINDLDDESAGNRHERQLNMDLSINSPERRLKRLSVARGCFKSMSNLKSNEKQEIHSAEGKGKIEHNDGIKTISNFTRGNEADNTLRGSLLSHSLFKKKLDFSESNLSSLIKNELNLNLGGLKDEELVKALEEDFKNGRINSLEVVKQTPGFKKYLKGKQGGGELKEPKLNKQTSGGSKITFRGQFGLMRETYPPVGLKINLDEQSDSTKQMNLNKLFESLVDKDETPLKCQKVENQAQNGSKSDTGFMKKFDFREARNNVLMEQSRAKEDRDHRIKFVHRNVQSLKNFLSFNFEGLSAEAGSYIEFMLSVLQEQYEHLFSKDLKSESLIGKLRQEVKKLTEKYQRMKLKYKRKKNDLHNHIQKYKCFDESLVQFKDNPKELVWEFKRLMLDNEMKTKQLTFLKGRLEDIKCEQQLNNRGIDHEVYRHNTTQTTFTQGPDEFKQTPIKERGYDKLNILKNSLHKYSTTMKLDSMFENNDSVFSNKEGIPKRNQQYFKSIHSSASESTDLDALNFMHLEGQQHTQMSPMTTTIQSPNLSQIMRSAKQGGGDKASLTNSDKMSLTAADKDLQKSVNKIPEKGNLNLEKKSLGCKKITGDVHPNTKYHSLSHRKKKEEPWSQLNGSVPSEIARQCNSIDEVNIAKIKQLGLDLKKQEKEILFLREENMRAKETIEEYKKYLELLIKTQETNQGHYEHGEEERLRLSLRGEKSGGLDGVGFGGRDSPNSREEGGGKEVEVQERVSIVPHYSKLDLEVDDNDDFGIDLFVSKNNIFD